MTNFVVSVFSLCCVLFLFCFCFCFWFYCALNTQQGGYVRITSLIIIIIINDVMCIKSISTQEKSFTIPKLPVNPVSNL